MSVPDVIAIAFTALIIGTIAGVVLAVWAHDDSAERNKAHKVREPGLRERKVRAELNGLRAANRINLAFWRAREELEAEADEHRGGGGRPW